MLKAVSAVVLLCCASTAHAATITYNISQDIGLGSVLGTIETDGTIGSISQANILDFNLEISTPGASIGLTKADSVVVTQGSALMATATDLLFNYSGTPGYLLFQLGSFGTGMSYYCNASTNGTCFQGASAIPESFNSVSAQVEMRSGDQSIGTSISSVPELNTWVMLLAGFGTMGAAVRERRKRLVQVSFAGYSLSGVRKGCRQP